MELKHVVVDGSNIATEGRSLPSLKQLDEAVRSFLAENPTEHVTVIVDATFGHRIDASERAEYEEAILAGELITPPAGAIGRGDKFVLQIADRADAAILSNDSFQEFHGEYTWLFDEGRLIGGKPVPGVGWVFLLRTPVRGPASRRSVRDARSDTSSGDSGRGRRGGGGRRRKAAPPEVEAVVAPAVPDPPRTSVAPINDPLPFIEFVANHPVGSHVEGEVERFASHGAYVRAGGARCYVGLKFMGDPAPRSAKDVLNLGETHTFAVHAFDTPRRGIDLALVVPATAKAMKPGKAAAARPAKEAAPRPALSDRGGAIGNRSRRGRRTSAGNATAQERSADGRLAGTRGGDATHHDVPRETGRDSKVVVEGREESSAPDAATARVAATKAPTTTSSTATKNAVDNAQEAPVTPVKKAVVKKAPAKKRAVAKKATAKKAAVKKAPAKKAVAKKAVAKKATAKKAAVRKAPAKKAVAKKATAKKAAVRKAPAKKAVAKKATAKKATAKKAAVRKAPARKTAAARTAIAGTATKRVTAVRKTVATRAPAKRAVSKRAPAKRAPAN
jgi:hypothetical protein